MYLCGEVASAGLSFSRISRVVAKIRKTKTSNFFGFQLGLKRLCITAFNFYRATTISRKNIQFFIILKSIFKTYMVLLFKRRSSKFINTLRYISTVFLLKDESKLFCTSFFDLGLFIKVNCWYDLQILFFTIGAYSQKKFFVTFRSECIMKEKS